jgi:tetratricopeptide (TPR) repeat protein
MNPPPTLAEAVYQTSLTYGTVGDDDGVAQLLDETLRLQTDHVMALNNRGYTSIEMGEDEPAIAAMIELAYRLDPRSESVADTLGWLRYKQGRLQDEADHAGGVVLGAVALLRRSVELGEEPAAEVYDHLGDALWRVGDRDGAVNAWNRALSVLEDPAHRQQRVEVSRLVQMQLWYLLVIDPETSYDREFGPLLQRLREKLQAVEQGARPPVALTFAEQRDEPEGVTR